MTLLCQNSTPAERARGCVFAEKFESNWHVQQNGGVSSGVPPINFGATFNGVNQYVTYTGITPFFLSAQLSVVIEFWPGFAATEDVERFFMSAHSPLRFGIAKRANASNNQLIVYVGAGTAILAPTNATYGAYWTVGARSVLVITATTGSNFMYLNGVQVATSATAWTRTDATTLAFGSAVGGGSPWLGRMGYVKFFNRLLTLQEARDYYYNVAGS